MQKKIQMNRAAGLPYDRNDDISTCSFQRSLLFMFYCYARRRTMIASFGEIEYLLRCVRRAESSGVRAGNVCAICYVMNFVAKWLPRATECI